ncbi:MAG: hypothetical protein Q8P82_00300 [bacterium]|nr:hypothetical protein [bacterium]
MQHKPLYRVILKKAWTVTWTNRPLWLFAFFATFLQTTGVFESIIRAFAKIPASGFDVTSLVQSAYPTAPLATVFSNIGSVRPEGILFLALFIAAGLLFLWIAAACEGTVIWLVGTTRRGATSFSESFRHGRSFAWRLVVLHVVAKLVLAAAFLLTSLPLLLATQTSNYQTAALYFGAFLIFFPLMLIVSFLTIYAACAIVLDRKPLLKAVETAWEIFAKHWLISLETALLVFAVSILGGIIVTLAALLLILPATLILAAAFFTGSTAVAGVVIAFYLIGIILLAVLGGSIITTFQLTTWTLLYRHISARGAVAKLVRFVRSLIPTWLAS